MIIQKVFLKSKKNSLAKIMIVVFLVNTISLKISLLSLNCRNWINDLNREHLAMTYQIWLIIISLPFLSLLNKTLIRIKIWILLKWNQGFKKLVWKEMDKRKKKLNRNLFEEIKNLLLVNWLRVFRKRLIETLFQPCNWLYLSKCF